MLMSKRLLVGMLLCASASAAEEPAKRQFEFTYGGAVTEVHSGALVRLWLPLPKTDDDQTIERMSVTLPSQQRNRRETTEKKYGNRVLYFECPANEDGEVPFELAYRVERQEVLFDRTKTQDETTTKPFRTASRYVPLDPRLRSLLMGRVVLPKDEFELAKAIYLAVDKKMKYDKPAGGKWGRGDALWACESGYGNCTDFHSLFLSACRTSGLAGKFEIGFPIPEGREGEVAGYHCWARFYARNRWVPVDISEADKHPELADYYFGNLTANRVLFSTGRDLELLPRPATSKVNFFVYPHVEVDGKLHKKFRKGFRFRELALP